MRAAVMQQKYRDRNPVVRFVLRRFFARIGAMLAETAPASVLDAGCGEGELERRGLVPSGARLVSLDLRHEPLDYLRRHSSQRDLVCASLHAIPLPDRSIDSVLCLEVLEHLAEPAAALAELARVARHALILSVPHEPYFRLGNALRGRHLGRWGNHPEHVQHWNIRRFRDFVGASCARVEIVDAFPWIVACCRFPAK